MAGEYETGYDIGFEIGKRRGYMEGHDDGYGEAMERSAAYENELIRQLDDVYTDLPKIVVEVLENKYLTRLDNKSKLMKHIRHAIPGCEKRYDLDDLFKNLNLPDEDGS